MNPGFLYLFINTHTQIKRRGLGRTQTPSIISLMDGSVSMKSTILGARKKAQQVKVLATKPEDCQTHLVEENQLS